MVCARSSIALFGTLLGASLVLAGCVGGAPEDDVGAVRQAHDGCWQGGSSTLDCGTSAIDHEIASELAGHGWTYDTLQACPSARHFSCARRIVEATRSYGLDADAAALALGTSMVETHLHNLDDEVDHDSLGLFQQRASWGSASQRLDPEWATHAFLGVMEDFYPGGGWRTAPFGEVCQTVQRSAHPDRYQPTRADAVFLADYLWDKTATPDDWAAEFASQSFPYASETYEVTAGHEESGNIKLKNVGAKTWRPGEVFLATTEPRDDPSSIQASDWVGDNRAATVESATAPGEVGTFSFSVKAPCEPGVYAQFFGLVREGVSWFSAPPEDQLQVEITSVTAPECSGLTESWVCDGSGARHRCEGGCYRQQSCDDVCEGGSCTTRAVDAGATPDAGTDTDAATARDGGTGDGGMVAPPRDSELHGGCSAGGSGPRMWALMILALVAIRRRPTALQ